MSAIKPKERKSLPSSMQKALFLCAVLVFCALIYVFMGMNTVAKEAVPETYAASPAPGKTPGLSREVVLERLKDAGLSFKTADENTKIYAIYSDEMPDDALAALKLYEKGGVIKGFSLSFSLPPDLKAASSKSEIERALQQKHKDETALVEAHIKALLPPALDAITPEGCFSPSAALACITHSINALETGKLIRETQAGFSFTAAIVENEGLVLAADLE